MVCPASRSVFHNANRQYLRAMKPGGTTLKMVADAAGVHASSVSRALDPAKRHLIGLHVLKRIEETALRLGYRRDMAAAALRTGRSRLVGVILPDVANPVFGPILHGVEESLAAQGYSAVVANAGGLAERAHEAAGQLIARRVEGLVLATAEMHDPVVTLCRTEGIPVVLVNRAEAEGRVASVISDDRMGMRLAVQHLVALGHSRIGHLAGPQNVSTGVWRLEGFRVAMQAAGLDEAGVVMAAAYSRDAGREAAQVLLAEHRPTAIAASNDLLALGAYQALADVGLRCPENVSIIGYNDMPLVDIVAPPMTSIRISSEEMGYRAGQRILAAIAGEMADAGTELLQPSLIIRQSTCRPRRT
jgi:LacI family transcriptional regulator